MHGVSSHRRPKRTLPLDDDAAATSAAVKSIRPTIVIDDKRDKNTNDYAPTKTTYANKNNTNNGQYNYRIEKAVQEIPVVPASEIDTDPQEVCIGVDQQYVTVVETVSASDFNNGLDQIIMADEYDDPSSPFRKSSSVTSKAQETPALLGEQDRFLPLANIGRIMKRYIPESGKVAKDAKECMQECVSEFISFFASEAADRCKEEKRKTISGEDILNSLHALGLESYVEPLKNYLKKYRASCKDHRDIDDIEEIFETPFDDLLEVNHDIHNEPIDTLHYRKERASNENNKRTTTQQSSQPPPQTAGGTGVRTLTVDQLNAMIQSGQVMLAPVDQKGQNQVQMNKTQNRISTTPDNQQSGNGIQYVQLVPASSLTSASDSRTILLAPSSST